MILIKARIAKSNQEIAKLPEGRHGYELERLVDSVMHDFKGVMALTHQQWSRTCLMTIQKASFKYCQRKLESHRHDSGGSDENDKADEKEDSEDPDIIEVFGRPRKRASPYFADANHSNSVEHTVSVSALHNASTLPAPSTNKFSVSQLQQYTIQLHCPSGLGTSTLKYIPLWNCVQPTGKKMNKQSTFADIGALSFDRLTQLAKISDGDIVVYKDTKAGVPTLSMIEDGDELRAAMHVLIMGLEGSDFCLPLRVMRGQDT
ncbi:hypothetical protein E4T39_07153 [Aureobasidium subglaciale]|nr:hypothetical protein E4T39_07153 [Aureobasidium subglaciale]